jgi:uroporphyrinogen decarboxylase
MGFWFHFLREAETGNVLLNSKLVAWNVVAHNSFIGHFHPDMVKIMSDGFFFYPAPWGSLETVEDLEILFTVEDSEPWIAQQVSLVEQVMKSERDNSYFYNIFSPGTFLRFLVGYERYVAFLREDPQAVAAALLKIGEGLCALARKIIKLGTDGIYLSVQNPDVSAFDSEFYAKYIGPSEIMVLRAAKETEETSRNILHICGYGGVRNRLADFAAYPAEAISYAANVEKVSLKEARAIFPGKVLIGGFPNEPGTILETGTKEEIKAFTKKLVAEAGFTEGLIIGADCTLPSDIPWERLAWVREALVELGDLSLGG